MRIAAILIAIFAVTTPVRSEDDVEQNIRSALQKLSPGVEISSIEQSPIEGVYEVIVGMQILYMTPDGKYLMQGNIYETSTRTDVTAETMAKLRKSALSDVDESQAITFSPDEAATRHEVTIFTDIDCGYCRRLHSQIDQYNEYGIAVHYMFFPRAGTNSHSFEKAVSVWCADDQQSALTAAKQGEEPEPKQCDNPVQSQFRLGQEVGVTGTPAIVAEDGTMLPGYMPPQQLVQRLDSLAAKDKVKGLDTAASQ